MSMCYQTCADWEEKFYNPKPDPEDVILPMPCDGYFVMRKIFTQNNANKLLDDMPITLGSGKKEQGYSEYAMQTYIAGSFNENNRSYYLMGKYPITQLQYNAVMTGECVDPSLKSVMPITDISWFDAIEFTNKYTQWLFAHKPDFNLNGYFSLPTNTEWEYAARGGNQVSPSEFRQEVFPMGEGETLDKYAFFSGSSNGKLQLVGRLKPNPLGLYDMLGNVKEMTIDSFRLNKLERYHGRRGGMILRGGSYLTSKESTTTAFKVEQPYIDYDKKKPFSAKDTGMRIVFTDDIIKKSTDLNKLQKEWDDLGQSSENNENKVVSEVNDLTQKLEEQSKTIAQNGEVQSNLEEKYNKLVAENNEVKNGLKKLSDSLKQSNQMRDEQRAKSIQSELQLGAFLCTRIYDANMSYENAKRNFKSFEAMCDEDDDMCFNLSESKDKMSAEKNALDGLIKYYADTVVNTQTNYDTKLITEQFNLLSSTMNSGSKMKSNLANYLRLFYKHLNDYDQNGTIARDSWFQSCSQVN